MSTNLTPPLLLGGLKTETRVKGVEIHSSRTDIEYEYIVIEQAQSVSLVSMWSISPWL